MVFRGNLWLTNRLTNGLTNRRIQVHRTLLLKLEFKNGSKCHFWECFPTREVIPQQFSQSKIHWNIHYEIPIHKIRKKYYSIDITTDNEQMIADNIHTSWMCIILFCLFTIDFLSYWSHLTQEALERISVGMFPSMVPAFLLCAATSAQVFPVAAHTCYPDCMFLFLF